MKFLIVFVCALAAASAGHIVAPVATVYHAAQHLPIIGANGVPVDTAEVQHARAAHLAHKVEAHVRNGDYAVAAPIVAAHAVAAPVVAAHAIAAPAIAAHTAYAAPLAHSAYAAPWAHSAYAGHYAGHQAYPTTAVLPSSVNGVPQETPEVAAARLNHYVAHAEASARSLHYRKRRGIFSPIAYSSPIVASTYAYSPVATSNSHQSSYVQHPSTIIGSAYAHPLSYAAHYY